MKERKMEVMRIGMKIGAVLGGIAFLVFGIVPGFHYGGYGTLMLLNKIVGGPLEFTLGVRMITILGILLGILCLGFMSIVLGSVFGTLSGYIVNVVGLSREPEVQEGMANNSK
jgi:hypothetical protein